VAKELFVDSGGVRIAVRDYGGVGVPLLLVHGHYGNLGSYDYLGPLLAESARVVAYDQRGHGWSESGTVTLASFAEDLAAVIAAVGLTNPVLYGGSFGTLVCLNYFRQGGAAAAFISEDGRLVDFEKPPTPPEPPKSRRRVLSDDDWNAVRSTFAAAGPTGEATAERSRVLRTDGAVEVLPSNEDLFNKEVAFTSFSILEAWKVAPTAKLLIAAERGPDPDQRRSHVQQLQQFADVEVHWFPTGHWVSAEDTSGVARTVCQFLERM
jgi:pimeloyl-ACP methyl ester carboxylesterase